MKTYSFNSTPNDVIREALGHESYDMTLVGEDAQVVRDAVNQGIDAHLEAITDSNFDWDARGRLVCDVAQGDMLVLLRRLGEMAVNGNEVAMSLRSSILTTLDIEEV